MSGWFDLAACRDLGDLMFPDSELRGFELRLAKKTCTGCPVLERCLADALAGDERYGVRGGLSTPERRAVAAGAPIRTCRACDLPYAAVHDRGKCRDCIPAPRPRTRKPQTRPLPAVTRDPTPDPRCGKGAGFDAHRRRGEHSCEPCRVAERERRTPRATHRRRRYDQHNVDMALSGNPPATLSTPERRAVAEALLPRRKSWREMARLMRCTTRSAERIAAAIEAERPTADGQA